MDPSSRGKGGEGTRRRKWLVPVVGLVSLVWFLARVVPKPSRAAYPCQRLAAPLAGGFMAWIVWFMASAVALSRKRDLWRRSRPAFIGACLVAAAGFGLLWVTEVKEQQALAADPAPHETLGVGRGIHSGRVVWVHDPDVTDWAGPGEGDGPYGERGHVNQAVVDRMLSRGVRALAGEADDRAAWDAVFRHFNRTHRSLDRGYQPGEKVVIKVNLVASIKTNIEGGECVDETTYDQWCRLEYLNTSVEMMLALLRQLVYGAGVAREDIAIGDTLAYFPNHLWRSFHPEFDGVVFFDVLGGRGRTLARPSEKRIFWSNGGTAESDDFVPQLYVDATYLINMANLKGHAGGGVTLCGKNHYGSLCRRPDAPGFYPLHVDLPRFTSGPGHYRALVDLMGHEDTGGKGLLYLIDGLWGTRDAWHEPLRWFSSPFSGDWPSSLFVSQDPVAIDSVAFDFLRNEWPNDYPGIVDGADDYLHEAALGSPYRDRLSPSGTFYDPEGDGVGMVGLGVHEHWNNAQAKQYSRNLGNENGIELVTTR